MNHSKCCADITFHHFINFPKCDCVFCSARECKNGRTRLFLIFNEKRRIYIRNGIQDAWDELTDDAEYDFIRQKFNRTIAERKIPCFTSMHTDYNEIFAG